MVDGVVRAGSGPGGVFAWLARWNGWVARPSLRVALGHPALVPFDLDLRIRWAGEMGELIVVTGWHASEAGHRRQDGPRYGSG